MKKTHKMEKDHDDSSDGDNHSEDVDDGPSPEEGDYKLFWFLRIQFLNNPNGLIVIRCLFGIASGAMSSGIANINVAVLEQRFGLNSSDSALIVVGYDIAFCVLTVFVTYFGGKRHRPRLVTIGSATYGLGSLVYALPHFLTALYEFGGSNLEVICIPDSEIVCDESRKNLRYNMYIILVGQLLMGSGVTPFYTLGLAYIEDSVSKRSASIYLGIADAASALGPVIGFIAGGVILSDYYVDFDKTPALPNYDPRWVGAWWVFPLAAMGFTWLLAVPMSGFPKQLPGTAKNRANRVFEVHQNGGAQIANKDGFGSSYKDLPRAILTLLKNPTYVIITICGCLQSILIAGTAAFFAKYIENAFRMSVGDAAVLSGAVSVPAGAVGNILGGLLIYTFKWKTPTMLKYCSFAVFSVACLSCCFLLHCRDTQIAGVNVPYSHCPCQEAYYIPVCGPEEVTYFSACQAGCTEVNYFVQPTVYSNCSCFPNSTDEAVDGRCPSPCSTRSAFLALSFFMVMFTFSIFTPMLVSTFRIVPESLRSFALGLEYLFYRALGTIPGPNLYGAFIDATCLLWQETSCGDRGFCWMYNNRNMALTSLYISVVGNGLSALLFFVGSFTYKPMHVAGCSTDMNTVQLSTNSDKDVNKKNKGHINYHSYDGNLYENANFNEHCTKL